MVSAPRLLARAATALSLALAGLVVLSGPVTAAPPSITSLTPNPVASDGTLTIQGECASGSPVSLYIWPTTGGPFPVTLNNVATGLPGGTFSYAYDLGGYWDPGEQLGVTVSCTATHLAASESAPAFTIVSLPDPFVTIAAPSTAPYGRSHAVGVRFNSVPGYTSLTLNGTEVPFAPGSYTGNNRYLLPADLRVGSHQLKATFDATAIGAPTVTDEVTLRVTTAPATVRLSVGKRAVRAGKRLRVTVALTVDGIASRAGLVLIKDGKKTVKKLRLPAAGQAQVKLRLKRVGQHRLRAGFSGNTQTAPARSPSVKVRVRK